MPELTLSLDPAWPWSLSGVGLPALGIVAALLVLMTVWTYAGMRGASVGRIGLVVTLRLLALAVALVVTLRPSVAVKQMEGLEPSKLLVVFDASASMSADDYFNGLSRWTNACRIWAARPVQRTLERLAREQQIEVVAYQGADDLKPFDPASKADGKRTDVGSWLHELWQRHGQDGQLRGLVIFSDGADNGKRYAPLELARQKWHGVCPIYTFGHGNPDDARDRKDIALTGIQVTPAPVPIKAKMSVKAAAQAPGFAGAAARVSLRLEGSDGKLALEQKVDQQLLSVQDNEIVVSCDAPEKPDEYKVTLAIEPLADEASKENNEISTYVQVTKEGVSVLWVEGKPRWESTFAVRALGRDRRFRVDFAVPPLVPPPESRDWYQLERKPYDVIVIADIAASRFALGHPELFSKIKALVEKQTGLLMVGGYETFANGGWDKTPLADVLPVTMDRAGQLESPVRMRPTAEGLAYPFLRLRAGDKQNEELWSKQLDPLDGLTYFGKPAPGATVLAKADEEPVLVASRAGAGRVLAFGGDTTARAWRRAPETLAEYDRFWRQTILWLSGQKEAGQLWVDLDRRRLLADGRDTLGFSFGLRGKTGIDLAGADFEVSVAGPRGESCRVTIAKEGKTQRGTIANPPAAGEYRLIVSAKGKDVDGSEMSETKVARFMVDFDDVEMANTTADRKFLEMLAEQSAGRFSVADEAMLLKLLEELKGQARAESRPHVDHYPDWRRSPASDAWSDQLAALWKSAALASFLIFVGLLCGEWGLRRWWGWV